MLSTNTQWIKALENVLETGKVSAPRGMPIKELMAYQTCTPMEWPVVTVKERELGYKFTTPDPSECNDIAEIPSVEGSEFQLKISLTGVATVDRVRIMANIKRIIVF